MNFIKPGVYQKHQSFNDIRKVHGELISKAAERAIKILGEWERGERVLKHEVTSNSNFSTVLKSALLDLLDSSLPEPKFKLTQFIAEEMATYNDDELLRFLYHRYRYDVFPQRYLLDQYPPYLQIEPSSLCNYRCVFCYQTDQDFFKKSSDRMGFMSFENFQNVVDSAHGKIEFLSLASRGEPMMCKDIEKMLRYASGKFLNLKLNTNASLLTEKNIHAILSGGVKTVVFSADAAEEPLYSQLRVNGKLERVLKCIDLFHTIRTREYSSLKIITRVSGVRISDEQNLQSMEKVWGNLVDQIAFVQYNPWENIYQSEPNNIGTPCSDLWRRMFVWFDGKVNPCDTDYKSTLEVGNLNEGLSSVWLSEKYQSLRNAHLNKARQVVEPCRRCSVV